MCVKGVVSFYFLYKYELTELFQTLNKSTFQSTELFLLSKGGNKCIRNEAVSNQTEEDEEKLF